MNLRLPDLTFQATPKQVKENLKIIQGVRKQLKAFQNALNGLAETNQAMCEHPNKRNVYDPGYAGGGYDGQYCPDCEARDSYKL